MDFTGRIAFITGAASAMGPTEAFTYDDFDRVFGVNRYGVVNGMVPFVPRMIGAGRPGHIVTTASLRGFCGADGVALYSASKAALVSLMESDRPAPAEYGVGVSVLCSLNIHSDLGPFSGQTRPHQLRDSGYVVDDVTKASLQRLFAHGMDPVEPAGHVKAGIERDELYNIPYPDAAASRKKHSEEVLTAVPPVETDPERTAATTNRARERAEITGRRSESAPGRVRSAPGREE